MKKYVREWLTKRHKEELKFFHKWEEVRRAESKEDVREIIREIKEAYDLTKRVFEEQGGQAFLDRLYRAAGNVLEFNEEGRETIVGHVSGDDFLLAVCRCFAGYELEEPSYSGSWPGGPVALFRLIDGRGSHFKDQQKVTTEEVKAAAEAVIERDGWQKYPVKRRGEGTIFPDDFKKKVAKWLLEEKQDLDKFSPDSVRWHLKRADFPVPLSASLKIRRR